MGVGEQSKHLDKEKFKLCLSRVSVRWTDDEEVVFFFFLFLRSVSRSPMGTDQSSSSWVGPPGIKLFQGELFPSTGLVPEISLNT